MEKEQKIKRKIAKEYGIDCTEIVFIGDNQFMLILPDGPRRVYCNGCDIWEMNLAQDAKRERRNEK